MGFHGMIHRFYLQKFVEGEAIYQEVKGDIQLLFQVVIQVLKPG
jgi:hypothetical protein